MNRPIVTLETWSRFDPTLFDPLTVPDGANRDLLINTICDESSEFGTIYHDPAAVKAQISILSERFAWGMSRDWRALHEEYNPLHNFDRNEVYDDSEHGTTTATGTTANGGSVTDNSTNVNSLMAFDSTTFKDSDRNENSNTQTINTTVDSTADGSTTRDLHHTAHLFGNIGTTKSQEMVRDEHSLATDIDFYRTWATMFINALCVCIY